MNCDVCGRQIHGPPNRVIIEGAKMTACGSCARLGTPYEEPKATRVGQPVVAQRPSRPTMPRPIPSQPADKRAPRAVQELDLTENYPQIVQKARRKHELSQEDLAIKVKERLSIIQKIELGKMVPNMQLAKALEHVLRVKLLVPRSEHKVPKLPATPTREVTLADVARIRTKDGKETHELEA